MTLGELLVLARDVARNGSECDSTAEQLALAVIDLLDVSWPCGYERPFVTSPGADGLCGVAWEGLRDDMLPDEILAVLPALFDAAVEAQKLNDAVMKAKGETK